jgi:hypothetical protein
MKFGINNLKRKTSLLVGGFLVVAILLLGTAGILIYKNYLNKKDNFLSLTPQETILYWHSGANEKEEIKNLLFTTTCQFFHLTEFSFLNETVSRAKEISLSLLSPEEAVLFLKIKTDENLKNKLAETNLNYLLEKETIVIANSKDTLTKISAVKNKKNSSLNDGLNNKLNSIYSNMKYPSQIYFDSYTLSPILEFQNFQKIFPSKSKILIIPNYQNENSVLWKKYNYILTSTSPVNSEELENFVKEKLAERFPILKEKILPDKTTIKEQIADPSLFRFETINIPNFTINYISEPRLSFEFVYTLDKKGKFYASDSKELLEEYLKEQRLSINIVDIFKNLWGKYIESKRYKYMWIKYVDKL